MALHRYFIWADRMQILFYDALGLHQEEAGPISFEQAAEVGLVHPYMSYWYAGTFALIEGWQELQLRDSRIDELLKSPNVDLLRRYRNCAFHFQADYFDGRFLEFFAGDNSRNWIHELTGAFSQWFLDYLARLEAGGVK